MLVKSAFARLLLPVFKRLYKRKTFDYFDEDTQQWKRAEKPTAYPKLFQPKKKGR